VIRLGAVRAVRAGIVVTLAVLMLSIGVLATRGGPGSSQPPVGGSANSPLLVTPGATNLADTIIKLQTRLHRVPGDYSSWASLGIAYVQQAAITGSPTYYPKAEGALKRSLRLASKENANALTGLAALAAARHQFSEAARYAREAARIDHFNASAQGVLSDALIQSGRYHAAFAALQRMLDLRPGVPAFTRASYVFELRGQFRPAAIALKRSLAIASSPSDIAFCDYYLGQLAWNTGDLARADKYYTQGLRLDPAYVPLLAGRADVAAARADNGLALRLYQQVAQRLPVPTYLIPYVDLLRSLGLKTQAARQRAVLRATQALFESQGVNVDPMLALFDADHGQPTAALKTARLVWGRQHGILAADAYAWALHVNGHDRQALSFARQAERLGTKSALLDFHRGMIEKSLGMSEAARVSLRTALNLNPYFSTQLAPRAVAALRDLRRP